jgi:hypothetical protein
MNTKFFILAFVVLAGMIGMVIARDSVLSKQTAPVAPSSTVILPPPPEEIPITVKDLIPETPANNFEINASSEEEAVCCSGGLMADQIFPHDPDIKSKANLNKYALIVGWAAASNSGPLHLYFTATPPGSECTYSDSGGSCPNPTLKVFNDQDNSVAILAKNDFTKMMEPSTAWEQAIYLNKGNAVLVMGRGENTGKFIVYPNNPYPLKTVATPSSRALLLGDLLLSFDSANADLSIENLATHSFNECAITASDFHDAFTKYFDSDHITINPDGTRVLLGGNKLIWATISDKWQKGSSDCINDFESAPSNTPSGIGGVNLGQWFDNGNVFAITAFDRDAFVFDFKTKYQTPPMLWSKGRGVGFFVNSTNDNPSGYVNTADTGSNTYSIQTEINKNNSSVDLYVSDGQKKSLIERIHATLVGPYGDRTSTWVRVFKDQVQDNLLHLLILDGYFLRQVIDVTIK